MVIECIYCYLLIVCVDLCCLGCLKGVFLLVGLSGVGKIEMVV